MATSIPRRRLGKSGVTVSKVGFGCARLGGYFADGSRQEMLRVLRGAFDSGITCFDTSDMYTQGESERLLGAAFAGVRDRVVIATKAGYRLPAQRRLLAPVKPVLRPLIRRLGLRRAQLPTGVRGSLAQDFTPGYITAAAERSLRRLRTDYIDLYQLHSPPAEVLDRGDFLEPLERLRRQGKVRAYGVSCETVGDAKCCLRYPEISFLQVRINLLDQRIRDAIIPRAIEQDVGLIARECFAGGLLARPHDALERADAATSDDEQRATRSLLAEYQRIADDSSCTLPHLALRFVTDLAGVSVTLVGMRTAQHLADLLRTLESPVPPAARVNWPRITAPPPR